MFKDRIERIKLHVVEHKREYIIGGSCLFIGAAGMYIFRRPVINVVAPVFNNSNLPVFNNHNIGNAVVNNAGHLRKIVQREDGELFSMAAEAAYEIAEKHGITFDRARWMLSRHLNGHLADVFGMTYKTIGVGTTG